jgi:signal peptide peptidase SppA
VSAVVIDVDSPGGMTDLLPELAADMRDARGTKPVLAVADTMMASAAYWIGAQADEVAVTPSGLAGSIGVFATHQDLSEAHASAGVKTTLVSAGKYKTEGNPFEPLGDEARAHLQELVDDAYRQFTADVAKGRRVTVDTVRGGFGEGRVLPAGAAVKAGLADRVATLEQTIGRASELAAARRGGRARAAYAIAGAGLELDDDTELELNSDPIAGFGVTPAGMIPVDPDAEPDSDPTDTDAAVRDGASFADEIDAVLWTAEELVAHGRPLTAAKRDRLAALHARLGELVALEPDPEPLTADDDLRWRELEARFR